MQLDPKFYFNKCEIYFFSSHENQQTKIKNNDENDTLN